MRQTNNEACADAVIDGYNISMDKTIYHKTLKTMQEAGVAREYCHGWATGALGNTPLEEQRVTDGYSAGFEDGQNGVTDAYEGWIGKSG